MTLPKSIFDQVKEMDKFKESLLSNSYLKTFEQSKNQELAFLKKLKVSEIERMKQNMLDNSSLKFLEQFEQQDNQYQKLIKNTFALPESALQAINLFNGRNNIYAETLNSLFRPPKLSGSLFENSVSKLFKELSRSPLSEFNKLAYPANLIDIMVGKKIQDFEKKYKKKFKYISRRNFLSASNFENARSCRNSYSL